MVGFTISLTEADPDTGRAIQGAALVLAINGGMWFFARRGHRWPRWALLVLISISAVAQAGGEIVDFQGARLSVLLLDVIALVALVRGWPARDTTASRAGT